MQGPESFGDYILHERIAVGGMAELFRADLTTGEEFETPICIKRILPHYCDDESFVHMFIDEATIAKQLHHPNIVKIYDFNVYDESYYIAMELIDGKDLKQALELAYKKQTRLTAEMVAIIARDTAAALHYAHARRVDGKPLGIVHRDVSPHNVLLGFNGDVKLTDFGIAKAASRLTHTRAGTVKGKCAYMSPEQARGKGLDGRSDLFSIGILMHEMLTGRRLFTGDSDFDILTKVIRDPIPMPSEIVPGIDSELEQICMRTLKRDRDQRWRDGLEMEEALNQWLRARNVDHNTVGLDRFMQSLFGRANYPLPIPGQGMGPAMTEDFAAAAAMPTAMLTPGMLPNMPGEPGGGAGAVDPNMQRTMALDMPVGGLQPPPGHNQALASEATAIFDLDNPPGGVGLDWTSAPPDADTFDQGDVPAQQEGYEATAMFDVSDLPLPAPEAEAAQAPAVMNAAIGLAILGVLVLTVVVIGAGFFIIKPDLFGGGEEPPAATAQADAEKANAEKIKRAKAKAAKAKAAKAKADKAKADKEKADKEAADKAKAEKAKKKAEQDKAEADKKDNAVKDDKAAAKIEDKGNEKDDKAVTKIEDKGSEKDDKTDTKDNADKKVDAVADTKGAEPEKKADEPNYDSGIGTITLTAKPTADIFIDGKRLGKTPITKHEVDAGAHVILFKNNDLRLKKRMDIKVASGEDAKVFHDFTKDK